MLRPWHRQTDRDRRFRLLIYDTLHTVHNKIVNSNITANACTVERDETPGKNESKPHRMLPDAIDTVLDAAVEAKDKGVYEYVESKINYTIHFRVCYCI